MGQGFGLGFAVRTSAGRNPLPGSVGSYLWAGMYGTYFWIDPAEKLFAVFMVQLPLEQISFYRRVLRTLVYQALVG
jgi:CubicO group peptidase (beta-lactamase class C family)